MLQLLEYVDYWFFSAQMNLQFKLNIKQINNYFNIKNQPISFCISNGRQSAKYQSF